MKETIVLINHYAGSNRYGMEFRPYYLGKQWIRMGYRVIIVAASFSHVRKMNPEISNSLEIERIDGIEYWWLKTPAYQGNGLKRVFNILVFIYRLFRVRNRVCRIKNIRVIIASSTYPLDIYPAYIMAKSTKARLFFEVHDLWPLSPIELGGYSRYHPFIFIMQLAEVFAYRTSEKVVSILPKTLEHMVQHGLAREKFIYIPNGIDPDTIEKNEPLDKSVDELIPKGKFLVGYAGSIGIANSMKSFILAADILRDVENIVFIVVGDGNAFADISALADKKKLKNLIFIKTIKKNQIQSLLSRIDVCFIGLKKERLYRFGISPNKIFDYMYAGRPILQAIKAGNDFAKEVGCGISVEPEDPTAIAKAIIQFYEMPETERNKIGENGKSYVIEHHMFDRLAEKFAHLFA